MEIINATVLPITDMANHLRWKRKSIFKIINRGNVWYNTLSSAQKTELQEWYQAWLDAPSTLIEPTRPEWLT